MQIVSCIKQGMDKYSKDSSTIENTHWWLTAFQNRGCLMEKQCRHHNCFHCKKAVSDSSASQIANMQHTHRCMRHHGVLMPECPSQWGCPVKSLGMSALLCFYTQVERWIWSQCETCMQETQKCQYSTCSPSNINNWQMEIKTYSVGQRNQGPYGTTSTKVWDK